MNKIPMTVEGFNRLQEELKRLKSTDRPAIIRAIAEARTHGDLAENAEYHAARERQGRGRQRRGLDAARQQILRNRHDVFQPKTGRGRAQAGQGPRGTLIRREPASAPTDLPSSDLLAVPARFA